MISTDSVYTLIGGPAFGPDGEKIGTVGQIYLDTGTGTPEWATVRTGLFGLHESLVPLAGAEQTGDGLRLAFGKDDLKSAPNIDADRDLSPEEEEILYDHYGLTGAPGAGTDTGTSPDTGPDGGGLARDPGVGYGAEGTAGSTVGGYDTDRYSDVERPAGHLADPEPSGGYGTDPGVVSGYAPAGAPVDAPVTPGRLRRYVATNDQGDVPTRDVDPRSERPAADTGDPHHRS